MVIQERGFLLEKLFRNPEFEQVITARGWHGLNDMVFGRRYESYVRGKDIDFSPRAINDLMSIVPPEQCDV